MQAGGKQRLGLHYFENKITFKPTERWKLFMEFEKNRLLNRGQSNPSEH
jgi:hypothetical protein